MADEHSADAAEPAAQPSKPGSAVRGRSGAVDVVRILGIVAVVAGHTMNAPVVRPLLYSWHVPLFFVLSGYFWSPDRTLRSELLTRTRTLLRPMLTWLVVIGLVFVALDLQLENSTWQRLAGPITNGENSAMPFTTFWFVLALFFSAVLLRLLWKLPRAVVWVVAGIGLVATFTAGPLLASTPLSIGSAVPCVSFMALGVLARTVRPLVRRPGLVGVALLVASAVAVGTGLAQPLDVKQGTFGTPLLSVLVAVAISFGLVVTAEKLFERLPAGAARVATALSYGGFMVVLTHPLILWMMRTFGPPVPDWLLFALCLLIPWTLSIVVLRTSASAWLTGVTHAEPVFARPRHAVAT